MIKKELSIFLIVGSLTVLTDFITYQALLLTTSLSMDAAKAVGFLTGTLFAYLANRFWTFGHKEHAQGSFIRFIILYSLTLIANIGINSGTLQLLDSFTWKIQVAFIIATGISATLNFIGMKWFAFKKVENEAI